MCTWNCPRRESEERITGILRVFSTCHIRTYYVFPIKSRLAARAMKAAARTAPTPRRRFIVNVASAAGLFPMFKAPVYAAAKGGLVHFTRSLAWMERVESIVVQSLCPQFVDTPLVSKMIAEDPRGSDRAIKAVGGELLTVAHVVAGLHHLLAHGGGGAVLRVAARGKLLFWTGTEPESASHADPSRAPRAAAHGASTSTSTPAGAAAPGVLEARKRHKEQLAALAREPVPPTRRVVKVHQLSTDFRAATRIFSEPLPAPAQLPAKGVLIRRLYTGVNASDVNFSAGRYHGEQEAQRLLPFDAGFESVGVVVAVGSGVKSVRPGDAVATMTYGGFSDYAVELEGVVLPVPEASPQVVSLLTSGLTAALGLEKGGMRSGEKVLVTAAAGGTGQFAVQLAKLAGNHVIATCGGPEKAALLTSLGVDRVIDYSRESVKDVLRSEYPTGVDVVFESVGGQMLSTCVDALARGGRLIIIGMMSEYTSGWGDKNKPSVLPGLAEKLLWKSASVSGFFLPHYTRLMRPKLKELGELVDQGKIKVALDGPMKFRGLERVADAVDRLQSGKSAGKVVLEIGVGTPQAKL